MGYKLAHITHEAVHKIGGIGAVLEGLLTSHGYHQRIERTILIGPLFEIEGEPQLRLGPGGVVLYSSLDGIDLGGIGKRLAAIEARHDVRFVYGTRRFASKVTGVCCEPEVLLIDVTSSNPQRLNDFKAHLWQRFALQSDRYEHIWEFEQYLRIAEPAVEALMALGAAEPAGSCFIVAHEFMGVPTALAAMMRDSGRFKTIFYAHETAPVRKIVEDNPGHDTMFYNVLRRARTEGLSLETVFGDQSGYFKYPLVRAASRCHGVLAVGDLVMQELQFLEGFNAPPIELVYNGVPAFEISVEEKRTSKAKLRRYAQRLLGYEPDLIFSHVTRLTVSKGLWRDLLVFEHIEQALRRTGQTAVLFVLSSELPRRKPEDIYRMEQEYGWPVAHREGLPDLSGGEAHFYVGVQRFNARARNAKVILVNQFGWDRRRCGMNMPEEMEFMDLRKGTDVEFGQSIYEPFGIAQLEPLSFGAVCVVSSICGCAGFVRKVSTDPRPPNVIVADYTNLPQAREMSLQQLLSIDRSRREQIERRVAASVAERVLRALPADRQQQAEMIRRGYLLARQMSWEVVVRDHLLPALERAARRKNPILSASLLR